MIGKDYKWYLLYTRNKHEKKVEKALSLQNVEAFLPIAKKTRIWSDRKKLLELPIFPNYIFVKVSSREYSKILENQSVIGFVKNCGEPSEVSDKVLKYVRKIMDENLEYTLINNNPDPGKMVEIVSGPLQGFEGEVKGIDSSSYITIEIKQLSKSLIIKMDKSSCLFKCKNQTVL